jgi:hypothetical protein
MRFGREQLKRPVTVPNAFHDGWTRPSLCVLIFAMNVAIAFDEHLVRVRHQGRVRPLAEVQQARALRGVMRAFREGRKAMWAAARRGSLHLAPLRKQSIRELETLAVSAGAARAAERVERDARERELAAARHERRREEARNARTRRSVCLACLRFRLTPLTESAPLPGRLSCMWTHTTRCTSGQALRRFVRQAKSVRLPGVLAATVAVHRFATRCRLPASLH